MAMPVHVGGKTDAEKFAGAVRTYTIEAMMGDKKALQVGTSHYLGQNFARAFDVTFLNTENKIEYVYATSWGVSTRLVGAVIMTHGDDKGLILPPKIAPYQIVIIPIWKNDKEKSQVLEAIGKFRGELKSRNIRYLVDDNEQTSPGWKFNQWEMKGVPLRVEIGPRDLEKNQIVLVRRDIKGKKFVSLEKATESIEELLETIQNDLFKKALDFREKNTFSVENYNEFKKVIKDGGFVKTFWAGNGDMEAKIQQETKATVRCILFDQKDKGTCFYTKKPADKITIFAKSY